MGRGPVSFIFFFSIGTDTDRDINTDNEDKCVGLNRTGKKGKDVEMSGEGKEIKGR